jgi:hypothetical protein
VKLAERIVRVAARSRAFYAAREGGHLLVRVRVPAESPPLPPLMGFDLDRQLGEWLDLSLAAARPGWAATDGLDDDTLPAICPYFGIAEHSAWLGMDVLLQESTCLPVPALREPGDLGRLALSEETRWFRYMREGYAHLRGRNDGSFVLAVRGTMAPMDLANALRGDELFVDFLAEPEFAHRLMAFCVRALRWYFPRLASWADRAAGGLVYSYGGWMGPRSIGHLSNDAALLCSPEVYAEFGFPYETAQVAGYDQVLYHVHNEKMHFVPRLSALPGLALLEVSDDPRTLPPLEDLPRIHAATGRANLRVRATSDQLRAHIGELSERNYFLEVRCCDRQDAADVIRLVRDRSGPLGPST